MAGLQAPPGRAGGRIMASIPTEETAMERFRHIAIAASLLSGAAILGGCMSDGPTRAERLALVQANAGEPVRKIHYFSPIGWDKVDDEHIVVTMRPSEQYLMRLSGPCLDFAGAAPVIAISSQAGWVSAKFDRVTASGSPASCRIEEIRPIDVGALRAAQASGT